MRALICNAFGAYDFPAVDNLVSDAKVFATVIATLCHKSDFNL